MHKTDLRDRKMKKERSVQSRVDIIVGRNDGSMLQNDLVIPGEKMQGTNVRRGWHRERVEEREECKRGE